MTLREIETALTAAGIVHEDAAFEARLLAARFTGISEARLLTMRDEPLPEIPALLDAIRRRTAREPLQYILGEWEFMGLSFAIRPACLIPRADTETLVETALSLLPPNAAVADLCTGSGCIAIALAHYRKDLTLTAVELFLDTLEVAKENARRLNVADRIRFLSGDVTAAPFPDGEIFDAIVSNPPYVTLNEMSTLAPELSFEPARALTDGGDGLSVIRGVFRNAARHLSPDGILLMEFGADQGKDVLALANGAGFTGEIRKDTAGHDRLLVARRAPNPL